MTRTKAAGAAFTLDRGRLARFLEEEAGEVEGVDGYTEDGIAGALSRRFLDARDARALRLPPGVEVIVYGMEDSVIVALRDERPRHLELPVSLRQLATYSLETRHVIDERDGSFEEACAAIEELLRLAGELMPSFEALRWGERRLGPDGRRRRLGALRLLLRRRR